MVSRGLGKEMMDRLEFRQIDFLKKAVMVKILMEHLQGDELVGLLDSMELALITKASMLVEFFALAMLWWEGLRALKIDISS